MSPSVDESSAHYAFSLIHRLGNPVPPNILRTVRLTGKGAG
jgi:hypothetical protein